MTHYRATYRKTASDALVASSRFAGFTLLSAWAQRIDADTLPVMGVATPDEASTDAGLDLKQIDTTLIVAVSRSGGDDLEDLLDEDSSAVEDAVVAAVSTPETPCVLQHTTVKIEGQQRVGMLTMTFHILSWRDGPVA